MSRTARGAAAVVAVTAWLGLALQWATSIGWTGSPLLSLWILSRYFTILTNLAVAVVFTGVATGRQRYGTPSLIGGVTLAIVLVGVIYNLLLRHLADFHGMARAADETVHSVVPLLVPVFWLVFVPKGALTWRDPWLWAAFPVAYLAYALVRGAFEPAYAYFFIDVSKIGWERTGLNTLMIAAGFLGVSFAVVGLDAILGRRRRSI
jgi:hypothetical protein